MGAKGVVVTGGASGLGLETARLLIARGYRVFLVDVKADAVQRATIELGLECSHGFGDVVDEAGMEQILAEVAVRCTLTGVVNCAGIGMDRPVVETGVDEFRRIIDVNLVGTFVVGRAAARHWLN